MILVTGGTGLLGNAIVRELCDRKLPVRVLCRDLSVKDPFSGLDVELVQGDLQDPASLQNAVQGCSAVIHSAAFIHIGWQKLELSRKVNVEGTRRLTEACQTNGIRLVHISTVDTLPAATSLNAPINEKTVQGIEKTPCAYVVSKTEAEQVVRQAVDNSLDAVIIHPGFMLGPYDWKPSSGRMMIEVNKAPVVAAPPGGCSFCDARDVASAIVNALENATSGSSYILAGRNLTYQELWREMLEVTGRKRRVYRLGPAVKVVGGVIDLFNKLTRWQESDVNGAAIAMGGLNHFYDSSKAQTELNYSNRPSKDTLREAWEWLKQHGKT